MAWEKRNMFGLVGGLNDVIDATMLKDIESPNMEDMYFKGVNIRTRPGKEKYNSVAITGTPAITGIYVYEKWNGNRYSVCAAGDDLWKDVSKTWTSIGKVGGFSSGADKYWDFASHNDLMIATNGIEAIQKWNGTDADTSDLNASDAPLAFYIEEFWNRLVACGNTTNPYRVWWSNLGNPEIWTVTDYLDIPQAGKINGMRKLGRILYIFAQTQTYAMYYTGNPDIPFRVEAVNTEVGCVAPHSIVEVNGWLYFVSAQGFMKFNGAEFVNLSEKKIHNLFLDTVDAARKKYTIGAHNEKKGLIWWLYTVSGGSTHTKIIAYDYKYDAWLPYNKVANYIYFNPALAEVGVINWYQTTQADFDAGAGTNIETKAAGTFELNTAITPINQRQETYNNQTECWAGWVAQSFKMATTCTLTKIEVLIRKYGSPPNLVIRLKNDNSNSPGTDITTKTILASSVPTSDTYIEVDFADSALTSNTRYWFYYDKTGDNSNKYVIRYNTNGGYANGNLQTELGGDLPNYDACFKLYYSASANLISQQYNYGINLVEWKTMVMTYALNGGTFDIKTQTAPDVTGSPGAWEAEASLDDQNKPTSTIETNTWFRWRVYFTTTDEMNICVVEDINAKVTKDFGTGLPKLSSGNYVGFVYKEDYGTNENTAGINAFWESKWHFFENPELKKIMRYLQVFLVAQGNWTVTIRYRWDYADAWTDLSKNLSGGSEEVLKPRFATKGVGHYLQFRFQHYVADQPFELVGFIPFIKKLRGAVRSE